MAIGVQDLPVFTVVTINATFTDQANEKVRKVSRVTTHQTETDTNDVVNILADLSHAGISRLAIASTATVDLGTEPNVTLSGLYTLNNMRLVLGFEREHPLNPTKIITASYSIPAPINAIVTATNPKKPLMTRGSTVLAAATDLTKLGALVDWLEEAIAYTAADGNEYYGGWTYVDARSGLATLAGIIDGDIRT